MKKEIKDLNNALEDNGYEIEDMRMEWLEDAIRAVAIPFLYFTVGLIFGYGWGFYHFF